MHNKNSQWVQQQNENGSEKSKLEDKSIEFILSKEQREKKIGRKKEPQGDLWDSNKRFSMCVAGISEGEKKKMKEEKYLKKLWSRTFQIW